MVRQFLWGTGILIGLYLAAAHATEFGKLLGSTEGAYSGGVKTLQGR